MEDSTKIIGEKQFEKATELFDSATEVIKGPVQFRHQFINMTEFEVVIHFETAKENLLQ
jgi:neutral ceramidase